MSIRSSAEEEYPILCTWPDNFEAHATVLFKAGTREVAVRLDEQMRTLSELQSVEILGRKFKVVQQYDAAHLGDFFDSKYWRTFTTLAKQIPPPSSEDFKIWYEFVTEDGLHEIWLNMAPNCSIKMRFRTAVDMQPMSLSDKIRKTRDMIAEKVFNEFNLNRKYVTRDEDKKMLADLEDSQDRALAISMATHHRLGERCKIPPDFFQHVFPPHFLDSYPTPQRTDMPSPNLRALYRT